MSKYWEGTRIIKSTNNAFNWKKKTSNFKVTEEMKRENSRFKVGTTEFKAFTTYSKAKSI